MTAKTTAERQRALRQSRADAGLSEVRGIWAHPENHAAIKAYAAKLQTETGRMKLCRRDDCAVTK